MLNDDYMERVENTISVDDPQYRNVMHMIREIRRLRRALKLISEIDGETNEALQSTCIDIANNALIEVF